jgi:hypothetical protein
MLQHRSCGFRLAWPGNSDAGLQVVEEAVAAAYRGRLCIVHTSGGWSVRRQAVGGRARMDGHIPATNLHNETESLQFVLYLFRLSTHRAGKSALQLEHLSLSEAFRSSVS